MPSSSSSSFLRSSHSMHSSSSICQHSRYPVTAGYSTSLARHSSATTTSSCRCGNGFGNRFRSRARRHLAAMSAMSAAVSDVGSAVVGVSAVVGMSLLLINTDPQQRRKTMAQEAGGDEMASVKDYFNSSGFDRWKKVSTTCCFRI